MTRQEKIIEIAKKELFVVITKPIPFGVGSKVTHHIAGIDRLADAIMALPIDVPSEEEIETSALRYRDESDDMYTNEDTMQIEVHWYDKQEAFTAGFKLAINEILKRNETKNNQT